MAYLRKYPSWCTNAMLRQIDNAWYSHACSAGWPPRAGNVYGTQVQRSIASTWCGGDQQAARWALADSWARERSIRWFRAARLGFVLLAPLVLLHGSAWTAGLAGIVAVAGSRTRHPWACEFGTTMPGSSHLQARILERFGGTLPAAVLLGDARSREVLLHGVDEQTIETVLILAPEWGGTVGELIGAAHALTH